MKEGEAVTAAQRNELDKLKGAVADKEVEQVKSEARLLENVMSKEVEKWKREVEISREEGKNLKRKVGELTEEVDRWKLEVQKSRQEEAKLSGEVEDLKMELKGKPNDEVKVLTEKVEESKAEIADLMNKLEGEADMMKLSTEKIQVRWISGRWKRKHQKTDWRVKYEN